MTEETFDGILMAASALSKAPIEAIKDTRVRSTEALVARRIVSHVCHELHRMSYPEIAQWAGWGSHNTARSSELRLLNEVTP